MFQVSKTRLEGEWFKKQYNDSKNISLQSLTLQSSYKFRSYNCDKGKISTQQKQILIFSVFGGLKTTLVIKRFSKPWNSENAEDLKDGNCETVSCELNSSFRRGSDIEFLEADNNEETRKPFQLSQVGGFSQPELKLT